MITEEQRKQRINSIGSSDCAAVLGLSRWSTPLKIWGIKTGLIPEDDLSDKFAVKWGTELEDTVAKVFAEETGKKLYRVNETVYHPKYKFLSANLDRRIYGEKAICECKTTDSRNYKEWEEENSIPQEIMLQCYHQLAVTGLERCYVAVAIGNREFKWRSIERDEAIINDLIKREVEFWKTFVIPKVMPKIISKNDADTLASLFPQAKEGVSITLGDDASKLCESLEALKQDYRGLEEQIDKLENELKALIGENEVGITPKYKIHWSNRTSKRLNTELLKKEKPDIFNAFLKESSTRYFSVKPLKDTKGE